MITFSVHGELDHFPIQQENYAISQLYNMKSMLFMPWETISQRTLQCGTGGIGEKGVKGTKCIEEQKEARRKQGCTTFLKVSLVYRPLAWLGKTTEGSGVRKSNQFKC